MGFLRKKFAVGEKVKERRNKGRIGVVSVAEKYGVVTVRMNGADVTFFSTELKRV